jgi:hypothetical protein
VPQNPPDFVRLVRALNEAGVRYVVIGGMAMVLHGSDYATVDSDFAVASEPSNTDPIVRALEGLHPRPVEHSDSPGFPWDARSVFGAVISLVTDAGDVDLLGVDLADASLEERTSPNRFKLRQHNFNRFDGGNESSVRDLESRIPIQDVNAGEPDRSNQGEAMLCAFETASSGKAEQSSICNDCARLFEHLAAQRLFPVFVGFGPAGGKIPRPFIGGDHHDLTDCIDANAGGSVVFPGGHSMRRVPRGRPSLPSTASLDLFSVLQKCCHA